MNTKQTHKSPGQDGFTLIELMIVVAIIGILAMVVIPAYNHQIESANRKDSIACLTSVTQKQELFKHNNSTYTTDLADLGYNAGVVTCGSKEYYTLTIAAGVNGITSSYIVTATIVDLTKDTACGDMTLSSTNVQGNVRGTLPAAACW